MFKSMALYWCDFSLLIPVQKMCAAMVSQRRLQEFQGFRTTLRLMSKKAEINFCCYWEPNPQSGQISVSSLNLGWSC